MDSQLGDVDEVKVDGFHKKCTPHRCHFQINRQLIPIKINYFCQFVVIAALFNFLNPLLSTYGLGPSELGLTVMFSYGSATISRLIFGPVADRTKRKHLVISGLSVMTTLMIVTFFMLPRSKEYLFEGHLAEDKTLIALVEWSYPKNSTNSTTMTAMEGPSSVCWPRKLKACNVLDPEGHVFQRNIQYILRNVSSDSLSAVYLSNSESFGEVDNRPTSRRNGSLAVNISCGMVEENYTTLCVKMQNERPSKTTGLVYAIIIILRSLLHVSHSPIPNLLDSLTYGILGEEKSHFYGKTRAFGTVGYAVASTITAYLIYIISKVQDSDGSSQGPRPHSYEGLSAQVSYAPCLVISAAFAAVGAIVSAFPTKCSTRNKLRLRKALLVAIRSADMIKCLVNSVLTGITSAFIGEYLFLILINEYKIPHYFLSIMTLTLVVSEVPGFFVCGYFVRRFGETTCVSISHLLNMLRFLSLAYFVNYWYFLFAEIVCGISFALLFNAVLNQGAKAGRVSSADAGDVVASMHALTAALLFNFMPCVGGLLWGLLLDNFTGKHLFYFAACYSLIVATLVPLAALIINKFVSHPHTHP
ncbi:unnamed protein product [Calicophoron daubneyi]|uniref:Major facilitator superfamily associated domain-containing protein n=1 Tax=Calicophoron daubneyi TaxID=300641 RepID=A0AAV2TPM2_CALDB